MRLLIFLGHFFLTLVHCQTCPHATNARIQECVQPVAEFAKVINNHDSKSSDSELGGTFSLPKMGARVFNELCKHIARFNSCIRDHRSTCPRHVTISLIDASYGYLCNEGYNTFIESAECLMELDRQPSVKACHDETLKEIEMANTENGIDMSAKVDRMCGALNFFSGCVRNPIKTNCGFKAWQIIYRVLKDTTNTLMPACQFTGTSQKLALFQKQQESTTFSILSTTTTKMLTSTSTLPTTTTTVIAKKSDVKKYVSELINSSIITQLNLVGFGLSLKFDPKNIKIIVDAHNKIRSDIARGIFKSRGRIEGPASNMQKIIWDDRIAENAQKYADITNKLVHSTPNQRLGLAENANQGSASIGSTDDSILKNAAESCLIAWAREAQSFGLRNPNTGRIEFIWNKLQGNGHVINMIASGTNRIGCGISKWKNGQKFNVYVFCQYKNHGNLQIPNHVYLEASTCSQCPPGTICDNQSGLCKCPEDGKGLCAPDNVTKYWKQ
ncbi:unnamed protein product [Caenorhabditis angaria]|uniref:SCP domain-containing protein n=1 Tax=Caenorhabditis angaria TaxID=860376 RepID=A0A9P1MYR8_9PELO|nr:unnamed protein product [Caenorhabditis angaria]